jgi:ADP-L-glycero-D-manno-heptose 6-epimerase
MIILTGVSGFIGSCMLSRLNEAGFRRDVVVVDDFYKNYKDANTANKVVREWMHRDIFLEWFEGSNQTIDFVIHLGARTDTTSQDVAVFDQLNLEYSKRIWQVCARRNIPLIYASSAATYGYGDQGFDDNIDINTLAPLNPYAKSKQQFDQWANTQTETPPYWIGCKFFNVYGPNEYHKGRMASVIFHTFQQIVKVGEMKLFKSHKPEFEDGHQSRDFIYVKDIVDLIIHFMTERNKIENGLYNFGTGRARTFLDLATSTFTAMDIKPKISFVDTPTDIRDSYQYFTEAIVSKLHNAGYTKPMYSLEDGIKDYVQNYLISNKYY